VASKTLRLSASQEALDKILAANGDVAKKITAAFTDRSMLHGYRTGRRKPRVDESAMLHSLTNGDVAATGWATTSTVEIDVAVRERAPADAPPKNGTDP
jgi:hypothetical protein